MVADTKSIRDIGSRRKRGSQNPKSKVDTLVEFWDKHNWCEQSYINFRNGGGTESKSTS